MEVREKSFVFTSTTTTKLKREDCQRTKHDSAFSDWKILIGPSDWEDHLKKKEGAEKYRTHNLPNCSSCPGLYEFGVALLPPQSGREVGKLKKNDPIPVYIGQSDNVRTRLQRYGREGAHLDNNGFSKGELEDSKGNTLFADIFRRGFSIVYRWAPMENKSEAERKEAQLLNTFDYSWNKGSNGARRPHDIHRKLDSLASKSPKFHLIFKKLQNFPQRQVGLKINTPKPIFSENRSIFYTPNENNHSLSRIFKFGRSQPRLVSTTHYNVDPTSICGVALGQGSVCIRPPVEGRKRCAEHKGMKINVPDSKLTKEVKVQVDDVQEEWFVRGPVLESRTCYDGTVCGMDFEDGTFCTKQPVLGQKRCEEHKGMRVKMHIPKPKVVNLPSVFIDTSDQSLNRSVVKYTKGTVKTHIPKPKVANIPSVFIDTSDRSLNRSVVKNESSLTCGATTLDGSFCRRKPSNGSKWCWQHEGNSKAANIPSVFIDTSDRSLNRSVVKNESSLTCGATTLDGSFCRRKPSDGSKWCWQHEGNSKTYNATSYGSVSNFQSSCGAITLMGTPCSRAPAPGRQRCWQHEGTGLASSSRTYKDSSYESVSYYQSSCGAITQKGTPCSRAAAPGRQTCWQH